MSRNQSTTVPFNRKRWPKIVAVLVLLVVGVLLALPYAISYSLEQWLLNNGAQSAEIKKVRLNLFTGTAGVEGVEVKLDDNIVIGDNNIHLNFGLSSLFKKEGHLETGTLSGLIFHIEQYPDGSLRIGPVTIPPSSSEPEEVIQSSDAAWLFRASHLELENCRIRFDLPKLKTLLVVKHALLTNLFTGTSNQPAHLSLQGSINKAQLGVELDQIELEPEIVIGGHVTMDSADFQYLRELLADVLDPFTGLATLDGDARFTLTDEGAISAIFDGDLLVEDFDIGNSDFSTQSQSITYNGTIQYDQDTNLNMEIDVNGMLQGDNISVGVPAADLNLVEENLKLDGKTRVSISNGDTVGVTVSTAAALNLTDFNMELPPLHVTHSGMDWQGHVQYVLPADSGSQTVDTEGKLTLHKPGYGSGGEGFAMNTGAEQVNWNGLVNLDLGSQDEPMTILVNGLFNGTRYQLTIPDMLDFKEDALLVEGKSDISIGKEIKVSTNARQDHTHISLTAADTTSSGSVSWQGQAGYLMAGNTSEVLLDGKLKAIDLESLLAEQNIHINQQDLSATAHKIKLKIGETILLGGKAALQAGKLQVDSDGSPLVQLETTAVNGLTGTDGGGLQVDTVTLSNLAMPASKAQPIAVSIPEITMKNLVSTDFTGATVDTLQVKQPAVHDTTNKTLLAQLDAMTGKTITVDKSIKISLASVSADTGAFLKKEGKKTQPQVTLGNVKADKITWSAESGFACNTIDVHSLFANYTKVKSPKGTKNKEKPRKKEQGKTAAPAVKINKIVVTGTSGFTFVDKSTSSLFHTTFMLKNAEIKKINSSKPQTPLSYKLKGKFDKYAPLDISGTCAPFAKDLLVDSKISLRNFSLQQLSPYVVDAIGTKFVSGQMNVTSDLKITGDQLDLENNLFFQQIKAETIREDALAKLNNELPVPLDLALTMLRDSNGDIDLNVPLSGPLDDLHVNPNDIIITALSKAIAVAVTPYLAYTVLGPAGALAYVGLKAGQAVIDTSLPSLEFADRKVTLTDAHKEILEKIGKDMEGHKDQDYSICSKVLLWELAGDMKRTFANQQKILKDEAMRKELLALAGTRAENVRQYLLNEFSIEEDHLLICSPTINFAPEGKPMVGFRK